MSRANPLKKMISSAAESKSTSADILDQNCVYSGREIIDNAFDAIFVHTINGKLLEVNKAACQRLGYARDELVNKEREELIALTLIGSMPEYIEIIEREGQLTFESISVTESGELIPVEVRARKISYQGEDAILTFSRDLTEQKDRENIIREKLEALQQHAVNISRLYSIENVAAYSFEIIEELLGSVRGAIGVVDEGYLKFVFLHDLGPESIPPLPLEGRGISVRSVRTGETQIVGETRFDPDYVEGLDGPSLLSELDVPIKIDGKVVGVINLQLEKANAFTEEDIKTVEILSEHISSAMARVELLKTIKKAEEKWHQLLESSLDSVIVLRGTTIQYVNSNTAMLLGYSSSSELVGGDANQIFSRNEIEPMIKFGEIGQRTEKKQSVYELHLVAKNGLMIPVEAILKNIEFEGNSSVVAFARDIRKRKKYEQQILSLHHHAVAIQKAKSEIEIVNTTLDTVEQIIGCHLISYLRMTEEGLLAEGNRGSPTLGKPLPMDGKGITVRAAREQKTILIEDTRKSPDFFRGTSNSMSELAVPVILNGVTIGVINLEDNNLNTFNETDAKIIETLALHVASAQERIEAQKI